MLLLLAGGMPPVGADEPAAAAETIVAMNFMGLASVDSSDVLLRLKLKEGEILDKDKMSESVRALYGMRVFSKIDVQTEPVPPDGVRITWIFEERPRVLSVGFQGYDHLGEADLKEKITLRKGRLLDKKTLEQDRKTLEEEYRNEGFPQAKVEVETQLSDDGVAVTYKIDEGKRSKIRKITFKGNVEMSDDELRGKLKLKKKALFRRGRYSSEKLEEDKERIVEFYKNEGFKDARILGATTTYSKNGEDLAIEFEVEEGPLYVFGDAVWEGSTVFDKDFLNIIAQIRRGDTFSQEKLENAVGQGYSVYTEKGYLVGLYIDPELSTHADTVDVTFRVKEGEPSNVYEVSILGNVRTREYVIRRELSIAPGDLLRRSVLLRSQRDVMALGFFEDIQIDYGPSGIGSDISVSFKVKERSTGTASAGAGYSSDTGLTGFVDLGHNNLFGRGQSVQIHLERGGKRRNYNFSFTEPWLYGRPTTLGLQVFNTQRTLDLYTEERKGGNVRIGRPWFYKWPDYTRVYLGYTLEDLKFSDMEDLDDSSRKYLTSGAGTSSQISLTFVRSSTDNPFYPTLGSVARWSTEIAGGPLSGDLNYVKSTWDLKQYFVPFWKPTVMLRYKLGHLAGFTTDEHIPGNETFRLGGTTFEHLRGYDDFYVVPEENVYYTSSGNEIRFPGGKFMFTFTAEYQFPIVSPLHGLLFFDAGNTWNTVEDFNLSHLKKSLGLGMRLEIPMLGQVGLDYAYNIEKGRFRTHLILGPSF
ncbi:MAG: outer membrane protein assembly factor BamA [Candidatus Eisenbacteria bacterium]|uniref:Outer membrane protein assembly factor BamA n=1 Tax=Eiseniibacteriota bacterium TaxID=2212470 RepID=A0A948RVK1_UNCEI|nr:outer membrane protein assembly factor BamA [Candidatus Eisenbacteria bacterium]